MFSACASQPLQLVQPYLEPANSFFGRIISLLMEMVVSNHFPFLKIWRIIIQFRINHFIQMIIRFQVGVKCSMSRLCFPEKSTSPCWRSHRLPLITDDRHRTSWEIDLSPPWTAPSIRITFPPAAPFHVRRGVWKCDPETTWGLALWGQPKITHISWYFVILPKALRMKSLYGSKHRANGVHTNRPLSGTLPRCAVS